MSDQKKMHQPKQSMESQDRNRSDKGQPNGSQNRNTNASAPKEKSHQSDMKHKK
jgi:hypothetical protein